MEENLLLEQYSRFKKLELEVSPYKCLLNTNIEINPHQVNAFCAAISALKNGGIILADEVGLGKTIEAGLALKYVIDSGAKHILIALPATLRKQWEIELDEKFQLKATILDRLTVEKDYYGTKSWIEKKNEVRIVIASYDYASKLINRFPDVKWDLVVIDEAHNLRNVFHGTKRAKRLYESTEGIPKLLLTATPLQNSLSDLHGLVSFIDPRIFGDEKVFNARFIEGQDYKTLKEELKPVLYRTLRKDVGRYMEFKKRICATVDFHLSPEELELYNLTNTFLKQPNLYSIPTANRGLIVLVIRKLLASSSFALVETFEVLKKRLDKLSQGTKSSKAQEGFDLFWSFVEDELDDVEEEEDESLIIKRQEIAKELELVQRIIDVASAINSNAKINALKVALRTAFADQEKKGIPQKVVVFTESKRTQKYIASELRRDGYNEEDIVLFNGEFDDAMTKEIYHAWQVKNYGKTNYGRSVEYKHAIVDYFKNNSKILVVTDSGSEGLNLQFCNTIINYDLPWNPQKIEQRIGRCHRYGQLNDVVAMNLLNTDNEADKRVYEILRKKFELFEGVFGASDIAIGALESGASFEKTVLDIYQKCNTKSDFEEAFKKLNKQLDAKKNKQVNQLRSLLLTENPKAKGESLDKTKREIDHYLYEVDYWNQFDDPEMDANLYHWEIKNWGEENFASHGTLFLGAFCDNSRVLFPVLLLCDEYGNYVDFNEQELVTALENARDEDIRYFTPTKEEEEEYQHIYDNLLLEMTKKYEDSIAQYREYNQKKIENWVTLQKNQLAIQNTEVGSEVDELILKEIMAVDALEKADIRKKITEKRKQLERVQNNAKKRGIAIEEEAKKALNDFNESLKINPLLTVNIILKF